MDPLKLLKTFFNLEENIQPAVNKLKPGQIIVGKVIRLLPNEMAEIQVGSQKLMAKIEISLLTNQPYFFQVQSDEGKIRLKVIKQNSDRHGMLNDQQPPLVSKESLDKVPGFIEQFITQYSIPIEKRSLDIMIQWNGKKRDDGKLDPNYCRILLYLNLDHIGDTFVDLHIQNRVMSVSVENDNADFKIIAAPYIQILKEKLSKMDYYLSSISFEQISNTNKGKNGVTPFGSTPYEGVDFRI